MLTLLEGLCFGSFTASYVYVYSTWRKTSLIVNKLNNKNTSTDRLDDWISSFTELSFGLHSSSEMLPWDHTHNPCCWGRDALFKGKFWLQITALDQCYILMIRAIQLLTRALDWTWSVLGGFFITRLSLLTIVSIGKAFIDNNNSMSVFCVVCDVHTSWL